MTTKPCVECGAPAEEDHHVVPQSMGGTFTVPLCSGCHGKVHGMSGRAGHNELTKRGLDRSRAEDLAAVWAHSFVQDLDDAEVSKQLEIPRGRLARLKTRVEEMTDEWRQELFTPITGPLSIMKFSLTGA